MRSKSEIRQPKAGSHVARLGILLALAMIFSYVEALIPLPFAVPGIKLGLANLVTVTGLYYLNPLEVLGISVARILLSGFLFGNGMAILFSLSGGLLSFLCMWILKKTGLFSVYGVSLGGGCAHNLGQLLAAILAVSTVKMIYYLPVLLISGTVTGFLIGILSARILPIITQNGD